MIDCHCHILPQEICENLDGYGEKDLYFRSLTKTRGARFVTGEKLLEDMAVYSIDKAVIFGFAFKDTGINSLINDYTAWLVKEHPGKFLGLGVICPAFPGAAKEAERCISLGLSGLGEMFPAGHGYELDCPEMKDIAGIALEYDVPLIIHVNEQIGHAYPGKGAIGHKEAFSFAQDNPGVTIIYPHFGGGLAFFYSMPEVRNMNNVYYDTAAQPYLYTPQVYMSLKCSGALDRVLLGSDYPLLPVNRYINDMKAAGLSGQDMKKVIAANAMNVFGAKI